MKLIDHLDKLNAFCIVAETGKLREASLRLHLTQPSLTRLIQTLEHAAGRKLFHRSRQGVKLTEAGQVVFDFAKATIKNLEDAEERLKAPTSELAGLIRIGSYESLAEYFWPDFVASMKRSHPELKITIKTNEPSLHHKALELGLLDMVVDAEPRMLGDFISWVLYEDRFNFYGKAADELVDLDPNSISDMPLIYCPQAFDHQNKSILHHLEEAGYYFKEKIELDSFTSVATFAKKGLGLSVLPNRLAEIHLSPRGLEKVGLKGFAGKGFGAHSIYATTSSSQADQQRIKVLVRLLREWFKK